jgi:hypothetical protein
VVNSRTGQQVSIALAQTFPYWCIKKPGRHQAAITWLQPRRCGVARSTRGIYLRLRGQNEGQKNRDLVPGGVMTNATVAGIASAPQGQLIEVA